MKGRIYLIENQLNKHKYIGKTYLTIEERWKQHKKDAKKDDCLHRPLYAAINKYGIDNFIITLIEETENLEEREKYWIAYYNSYYDGYNATTGGDGRPYIKYSDEEIINKYLETQSIQETAKYFQIGTDSVSLRLKNNNIQVIPGGNIYNPQRNWTAKKVQQLSLTEEYFNEFDSTIDAARYLVEQKITNSQLKHIVTNIGRCCKKQRKTAYGFIWKYIE